MAARRRGPAPAVALPAPKARIDAGRLLPSRRSIAVGLGIVALAAGAYAAALETSIFAVQRLEIVGGTPRARAEVRRALQPELGRSLLRVRGSDLAARAAVLPDVIRVGYDRAFPHTLRIVVTPERAVMILRRGKDSWVVSALGRVMRPIHSPGRSSLPRLWVAKQIHVAVGARLSRLDGAMAAAALAPAPGALGARVRTVRASSTELTLVLRTGVEIRLGSIGDLRLKLAIAARILQAAGAAAGMGGTYVDVSVPERPVLGTPNPQVGGRG